MDAQLVAQKLLLPLLRLCAVACLGLFLASLLESLHWTRFVARLASPLARLGHLREVAAASFALAFFSPAASNSLLAEAYDRGELSRRECIFANLFNSSPTFLVHLPTLFTLVFAFLGPLAFVYVGLTFAAAFLRTLGTVLAGRLLLPPPPRELPLPPPEKEKKDFWRETLALTARRFKKRAVKLLLFTVPVYCLFFVIQQAGGFERLEALLAEHSSRLSFLDPKAVSIMVLYLLSESGAALAAAASLADAGALPKEHIIMALLAGNILSAPMRAVRHQFPSYAGYFKPALALELVFMNQLCRAVSLALVAAAYCFACVKP